MAGAAVDDLKIGGQADTKFFNHIYRGADNTSSLKDEKCEPTALPSIDLLVSAVQSQTVRRDQNKKVLEEKGRRPEDTRHVKINSSDNLSLGKEEDVKLGLGDGRYTPEVSFQAFPGPDLASPFIDGPVELDINPGECVAQTFAADAGKQVVARALDDHATEQVNNTQLPWDGHQNGLDPPTRWSGGSHKSGADCDLGLEQQLLEEAMKQQSKSQFTERFNLSDIAENPNLAKAAKMELSGKSSVKGDDVDGVSTCDARSRFTDLERIRFISDTADRDAEREAQAGVDEVDLIHKRLEMGRRSVEQLLKLVQKLYQADFAYSRALLNAARTSVSGIGYSDKWKCAGEGLGELPLVIAGAHSKICQLLAECSAKLQGLLKQMKKLSDSMSATLQKVLSTVATKRTELNRALSLHEAACRSCEEVWDIDSKASRAGQKDPWLTEGRLAAGHSGLLEAQHSLRSFLAELFKQCKEMEINRLQITSQVIMAVLKCYGPTFEQHVTPFLGDLQTVIKTLDTDHEIVDLLESAAEHADSATALGLQKTEDITVMCGDLFASPDIIRQGELEMWDAEISKWAKGHFVLTQAGYLYGFSSKDHTNPVPNLKLALSRCAFEQSEAPIFNVTEGGTGWMRGWRRGHKFKAPSVDDCCEWAIAVRETIADTKSRK